MVLSYFISIFKPWEGFRLFFDSSFKTDARNEYLKLVWDVKYLSLIIFVYLGQFLSPDSRARVDVEVGNYIKIAVNHEVNTYMHIYFRIQLQ